MDSPPKSKVKTHMEFLGIHKDRGSSRIVSLSVDEELIQIEVNVL
jgi:hypothetical protein